MADEKSLKETKGAIEKTIIASAQPALGVIPRLEGALDERLQREARRKRSMEAMRRFQQIRQRNQQPGSARFRESIGNSRCHPAMNEANKSAQFPLHSGLPRSPMIADLASVLKSSSSAGKPPTATRNLPTLQVTSPEGVVSIVFKYSDEGDKGGEDYVDNEDGGNNADCEDNADSSGSVDSEDDGDDDDYDDSMKHTGLLICNE